jgi:hypothetical protein
MTSERLVQVIAVAMALVLVLRGLRASNRSRETMIRWAAIWVVIITTVALLSRHFT